MMSTNIENVFKINNTKYIKNKYKKKANICSKGYLFKNHIYTNLNKNFNLKKINLFRFFIKNSIFIYLFLFIFQFNLFNNNFYKTEQKSFDIQKMDKYFSKNNRTLMENLTELTKTYENMEKMLVHKVENIYETNSKNALTQITRFVQKIDLLLEKEILRTLKYVDTEIHQPIKSGKQFLDSVKKFLNGLKIFSTPLCATVTTLMIYYFKSHVLSTVAMIGIALMPLLTTWYVFYKIHKVRSELNKKKRGKPSKS
ncbi:exported portein, unknown function [Hepatocystis sp. ex Piliocolobus tephrosceles]|nr:exported portein, unknown function [Hepatocystis sp. ex Piliocolobus tephrosceles]